MYDMFLEEGDLLEAVNVFLSKKNDNLNKIISESDMMISLYETQRFIIEQDTNIFMSLNYNNIITEGAIEIIHKKISELFEKIRKIITNFIQFIKTKRKKNPKSDSYKRHSLPKSIDETLQYFNDLEKFIKENKNKNQEAFTTFEKVLLYNKEKIEEIKTTKKYARITISEKMRNITNIDDIIRLIDYIESLLYILEDGNDIEIDEGKISHIAYSDNENNIKVELNIFTYEQYYKESINNFFYDNSYGQDTEKYINKLEKLLDSLNPLATRIARLSFKNMALKKYDKNLNKIAHCVSKLSTECTERIRILYKLEDAYYIFLKNEKMLESDERKINESIKQLQETEEQLITLKNKRK